MSPERTEDNPMRDLIVLLTHAYWNHAKVDGLDTSSVSHGLRFGFAIAMRHPEYAQAYLRQTSLPEAEPLEDWAIEGFIEAVPLKLEVEADVVPPSE